MGFRSSFLTGDKPDDLWVARRERVLAVGRLGFSVIALVAASWDAAGALRFTSVGHNLLLGHLACSIALLIWIRRADRITPGHSAILHAGDLFWALMLTLVTGGPASPLFLFFYFAVVAAAFRWGLVETVATTAASVVLFLLEFAVVSAPSGGAWLGASAFDLTRAVIRVGTLVATGFLLGYLGDQQKQLRRELEAKADASRLLRVDHGLPGVVSILCDQLLSTFQAAGVAFVVKPASTGETRLWRLDRSDGHAAAYRPGVPLGPADQDAWLFRAPAGTWHAVRGRAGWTWRVIDRTAWQVRPPATSPDSVPAELAGFESVMAADLGLPGEWTGRVYLFDLPSGTVERRAHFLESLTDQLSLGVTNAVLLERLRSQAAVAERARVARELHDGAIQSLASLDLRLEAIRRRPPGTVDEIRSGLAVIQAQLQREGTALRNLMRGWRPVHLDSPEAISDELESIVERFQQESSIAASFTALGGDVVLRRARAIEVLRIVQEALINVRKHSRAARVDVKLIRDDSGCVLLVEDDGRGFSFDGYLTSADLGRTHEGPTVLQERAQSMGATLAVFSKPGTGARVELRFAEDHHV